MPRASVLIFGLAAAVAIGGLVYRATLRDETVAPATPDAVMQPADAGTIANKWQWENFAKAQKPGTDAGDSEAATPRPSDEAPYDAMTVYKVLQSIRLDENGHVVPDQAALQALERGYSDLGPDVSPQDMSGLQELIRVGLPGPAGEEAARILEDYFRFRAAETEFNQLRMAQADQTGPVAGQLPMLRRHEELMELRRSYLGKEVADGLYAVEDAQARHMLAAIAIEQDADLTADEKQAQRNALQARLNDRLLALGQLAPEEAAAEQVQRLRESGASSADIQSTRVDILGAQGAREMAAADREEAQWQRRFNGFWQARRYVMQAGLDDVERERQIEQLLAQYFSPAERDRARATSLDWQAREAN